MKSFALTPTDSPSPLALNSKFDQVMTELKVMLTRYDLLGDETILVLLAQLLEWPILLKDLEVIAKAMRSPADLSSKLKQMRQNNLFAKLYRHILLHDNADLMAAEKDLSQLVYQWNHLITEACMQGLRSSHYASNDASWWALFQGVQDYHLAAEVLIEFIYRRPLPKSTLARLVGTKEAYVTMPEEGLVFPHVSMHEFTHQVTKLCKITDAFTVARIKACLMVHQTSEEQFMTKLQDVEIQLNEGAALPDCLQSLNKAMDSIHNFPNVMFYLLSDHVIRRLYEDALDNKESSQQVLSANNCAQLLLQAIFVKGDFNTSAAIKLRSALAERVKTKADLQVLISHIENPLLLVEIMIDLLPQILQKNEFKGDVSPDFNQLASSLVNYASEMSLVDYRNIDQLNRISHILKDLENEAKSGCDLNSLLIEIRNSNPLLFLYMDLLVRDECDWAEAPTWLMRIYRVWNDCVTAAVLAGYRKSRYANSDQAWWELFCITNDKWLAIAILKDFIYRREPDRSGLRWSFITYNETRVPVDNSDLPIKLNPPGLTNLDDVVRHTTGKAGWNDLDAIERGNQLNQYAAELHFKVKAAVAFEIEQKRSGNLAGILIAIEHARNKLYDMFKKECCDMKPKDNNEAAFSEFKFQLSEKQAPRILEVYHEHCIDPYVQPAVNELFDRLPPEVNLNEFIANIHHPRLLLCFLEKFLGRRQEQVARHRAALFARPIERLEHETTEAPDNTFSSCRMENAQPK